MVFYIYHFLWSNEILFFNFISITLKYYFSPLKTIFIFYCAIFFHRVMNVSQNVKIGGLKLEIRNLYELWIS